MKGNIAQLMQQAQKMQENMKKAQAEMAELEVTGESGGGMVKVTASGNGELRTLAIDESLYAPGEKDMLEDLIVAAVNVALKKAKELQEEAQQGEMQNMMGGMMGGMGGGGGMPDLSSLLGGMGGPPR